MNQLFQVATAPLYSRLKPERSPRYLAYIRKLACVVCGGTKRIEAAHTGAHGMGQRSSDRLAIPLCAECHQHGQNSLHKLGPMGFSAFHEIDVAAVIGQLNKFYESKFGGKL